MTGLRGWSLTEISIHAPRTGSDYAARDGFLKKLDISIHAPRTGSDGITRHVLFVRTRFQSTLPARGATDIDNKLQVAFTFQSTLPARGATLLFFVLL